MADSQNPGSQIADASGLTGIMDQSAQLESIYYNAQDDGISSAAVIAANLDIEEQLVVIDSQLASSQGDGLSDQASGKSNGLSLSSRFDGVSQRTVTIIATVVVFILSGRHFRPGSQDGRSRKDAENNG